MDTFVIVIIIVCAGIVLPSLVLCCVLTHRKQTPLTSQSRDLEMGKTGSKDGGLVVLTRNVSITATTVAEAVIIADSGGGGGCCCGCDDGGGGDGGGDGGGCGGCGGCGG
ncbi:uncharacterized protein LOC130498808 [Raphanus sativus]|uniref:Uncharacterized protein LOC130498808 n=1 Tax=Raphanus sativus TaxID=3726 RepID=A0A9W3CAA8_RAPSA|nr:uncharacterized protein LOC130498808 [Raphanus sativus]